MNIAANINSSKMAGFIDRLLLTILVLWYFLPAFSIKIRAAVTLIIFIITLYWIFINERKKLLAVSLALTVFILIFCNIIYFTMWSLSGISYESKMLSLFSFFMPLIISVYIQGLNRVKLQKYLVNLSLVVISLTCITTIIGQIVYPNASRILATGWEEGALYASRNIGGYSFVYSLVLLIPCYFYLYKQNKKNKKAVALAAAALAVVTIYMAQYTIAILLAAILAICALFLKRLNALKVVAISSATFLIIKFFYNLLGNLFRSLSTKISQPSVASRFIEISNVFIYNKMMGDSEARIDKYLMSLDAFLKNPVTGNMAYAGIKDVKGGHSEILDILASSGLFGLLWLVPIIFIFKKYVMDKLGNTVLMQYFSWVLLFFAILGFINTLLTSSSIGFVIFLLLPCAAYNETKDGERIIYENTVADKPASA